MTDLPTALLSAMKPANTATTNTALTTEADLAEPETYAVQWAPSGSIIDGVPGPVLRLLATNGKTHGYGGGPGDSMVFGTAFGDITVLPTQWIVLLPGRVAVLDDADYVHVEYTNDTYLGALEQTRCAACAAYPTLPCAQHRDSHWGNR